MAISMNHGSIDQSEREALLGRTVDNSILQSGDQVDLEVNDIPIHIIRDQLEPLENAAGVAGVTSTFVTNLVTKINVYIQTVNAQIETMKTVASSGAFQGGSLSTAISNFISAATTLATDFTNKLKAAEMSVVTYVGAAYSSQDANLSSDLNSDSSNLLENNGVSTDVGSTSQNVSVSRSDVKSAPAGAAYK